jgi:hypothetical protein
MTDENISIENLDLQTIYQQDKALIDGQVATAKAYPRNIKRATENAIAIATMDRETATTCTYSVPRGGKAITGPSVHLAKILAQCWGNMRIETKVIAIDAKQVTSQAIAFDLENNIAIKVEVRRSIMTKNGRMTDDMITVTGNAGNAIALRNAILSVIPKSIVDKAYNESKKVITGDISDATKLLQRRKAVFDGLKNTYNLTEAEILSAVGKAAIDHITGDDLVVLIGAGQAIKDGDTTVELAFKSGKAKAPEINKEAERIQFMIADCLTEEDLTSLQEANPNIDIALFNAQREIIKMKSKNKQS